jgi:hypothetical protein
MPNAAVGMLDVQIDRNLADVVQQGRVGRACGPGSACAACASGVTPAGSRYDCRNFSA